jgi:hypothetical protein
MLEGEAAGICAIAPLEGGIASLQVTFAMMTKLRCFVASAAYTAAANSTFQRVQCGGLSMQRNGPGLGLLLEN